MRHDVHVISTLLDCPWERAIREAARTAPWESFALGAEVDQRALLFMAMTNYALEQHAAVPEYLPGDISEAFDMLMHERTVRVSMTWKEP